MSKNAFFTHNFHNWPFWWCRGGGVPICSDRPAIHNIISDVIVIGAGYTGLQTALTLALSGKQVVVVDGVAPGWGSSTRNTGLVLGGTAGDLKRLSKSMGTKSALAVLDERIKARDWLYGFIKRNHLSCDMQKSGRLHLYHSEKSMKNKALLLRSERRILGDIEPLSRSELKNELGTSVYNSGVLHPEDFAVDPNRYHEALLSLCKLTDIEIISPCHVLGLKKSTRGFNVSTEMGMLYSEHIVVATNALVHELVPWMKNRIYPVDNFSIATDILPDSMVEWLIPNGRMATDNHKHGYSFRPSPDGRRLIFSGRCGSFFRSSPRDITKALNMLRKVMAYIFPELTSVKIAYGWSSKESLSPNGLSHIGCHNGIFYAAGYCGHGIALPNYLGMKLAEKILDQNYRRTASDHVFFQKGPIISGKPRALHLRETTIKQMVSWFKTRSSRKAIYRP